MKKIYATVPLHSSELKSHAMCSIFVTNQISLSQFPPPVPLVVKKDMVDENLDEVLRIIVVSRQSNRVIASLI